MNRSSSYAPYTARRTPTEPVPVLDEQQQYDFHHANTAPIPVVNEPVLTQNKQQYVPTARVTAVVPAHNESDAIAGTIRALLSQRHALAEIIIMCDNCDDNTEEIARQFPVTVMRTTGNKSRKAGALNQALALVLPYLSDDDMVLIQDADTELNQDFTVNAIKAMDPRVGGVCAQYDSPAPRNFLERLQSNEFARSRRRINRKRGETKILVGIASVFRVRVLRDVIASRQVGFLPGAPAVYDENSLTEDYELSLALRSLGYRLTCPPGCRPKTHAMPTLRKLWSQRVRWGRGGLDDLYRYGPSAITRPYIASQVNRILVMMSPLVYALYLLSLQLTYGRIMWDKWWFIINILFFAERVITVREEGWRAMLTAAFFIPELLYDWFMSAAYVTAIAKHLSAAAHEWAET